MEFGGAWKGYLFDFVLFVIGSGNAISIASEAIEIALPLCKYHCCWK
ncbi:hypothetical protein SPONL_112 [uncultured Candidatus Thioglobus sp.]|nr:hypothetical protein SPONL_112 [uncultured Candidatus Thioglobus sp.]